MNEFDLLIVGAGPAGSFAAELLAIRGAKVALFDGRPPAEPKACGGGVTAKALKAWPFLQTAPARHVRHLELVSPNGRRLHLHLDEPLAIYSRLVLDSYLRDRAKAAGAQVISEKIRTHGCDQIAKGWRLQSTDGHQWSGAFLVGADGANSIVARSVNTPLTITEMGIAFGYRGPLPESTDPSTVLQFLLGWPGYAWAFPRVDHISFGIAISQKDFRYHPLNRALWQFITDYYNNSRLNVQERLSDWFEPYAGRVPQLSPGSWRLRPIVGKNWALLGDAAGLVDPITDEGIYFALRSAELFAKSFLEGRAEAYEARCRLDFGCDLERAAKTRTRFYGRILRTPLTERMIQLAMINQGVKATLLDLITGRQSYVGLKRTLLRNALQI